MNRTPESDETEDQAQEEFVFNEVQIPEATQVLDIVFQELVDGWSDWRAVPKAAEELGIDLEAPLLQELATIVSRPLKLEVNGRAGAVLSTKGNVGMPSIQDTSEEVVMLWRSLLGTITMPAAKARLNDLLFERRHDDVGEHGRRAVENYLESTEGVDDDLETTTYLLRGWTLARQLKNEDLEESARRIIWKRASASVHESSRSMPGVLFPLLWALSKPFRHRELDPQELEALSHALTALAQSESRGYLAQEIASMRRSLVASQSDMNQLLAIDTDEVDAYFREANAASHAMVEMSHLEEAARVATMRGLNSKAKEAAARMQSIDPGQLGLQHFEESARVPAWIPESYIEKFTKHPHWQAGIYLFCTDPEVPTGDVDQHYENAIKNRDPISLIFKNVILGADNLPRATLETEEDNDKHWVSLFSTFSAEYKGKLLAHALHRMQRRYGTPSISEVAEVLCEIGAGDMRIARSLAKGFMHFWQDDFESSVAVVIPKIEAAARSLLRALDEGIYRVQVSASPGGYPGLHVLLDELENLALDRNWTWFLRWLLLGPSGQNLRNDYAHGFLGEIDPTYAALTLRAGVLLGTASPVLTDLERRVDLQTEGQIARSVDISVLTKITDNLYSDWYKNYQ